MRGESCVNARSFERLLSISLPTDVFDKFDEQGTGRVATTQLEAMLEAIGRNPGEGASLKALIVSQPD